MGFTTPDDTAPNFVSGYPQTPILTVDADNEQVAQNLDLSGKAGIILVNAAAIEGGPLLYHGPVQHAGLIQGFSEVVLAARNENGEDFFDSFEEAYNNAQGGSEEYAKIFADLLRKHARSLAT